MFGFSSTRLKDLDVLFDAYKSLHDLPTRKPFFLAFVYIYKASLHLEVSSDFFHLTRGSFNYSNLNLPNSCSRWSGRLAVWSALFDLLTIFITVNTYSSTDWLPW